MRFRKKPVVVEAIQWTGQNTQAVKDFINGQTGFGQQTDSKGDYLLIQTLEGYLTAIPNDWIIKGIKGEFYPCKPDIFEQTYELVEE